jgi:hypothetical protein
VTQFYDNIRDLAQVLVVTDGGATEEYGSFGWVISLKSGQRLAKGHGITFGLDPRSYRAENYGCRAAHTFIQLACSYLRRPIPRGSLEFHSDNQGMIKKLQWFASYRMAPYRSVLDSEWDLVFSNHRLLSQYPDQPTLKHVKGHQDRSGAYHDLSLSAQLNIEADALCTEALELFGTPFSRVPFDPTSLVQLVVNNHSVTRRIPTTLRTAVQLPALREYYCKRFQWPDPVFDLIDWKAFSQASRRQYKKRRFLTKH